MSVFVDDYEKKDGGGAGGGGSLSRCCIITRVFSVFTTTRGSSCSHTPRIVRRRMFQIMCMISRNRDLKLLEQRLCPIEQPQL